MGNANVARQMASAPLKTEQDMENANKAQETVTEGVKVEAKPFTFPTPVFKLVSNPKAYEDRNDKSKSNTRIAYVDLVHGSFEFQASIYLETKVQQRENGRHEEKTIRFSLPKGVTFTAAIAQEKVDDWKDKVIDAYIAWRKESGGAVVSARARTAGMRSLDE